MICKMTPVKHNSEPIIGGSVMEIIRRSGLQEVKGDMAEVKKKSLAGSVQANHFI